jgi:hypothetical protein
MTLSVAETVQHQMTGWSINNDIDKEAIMVELWGIIPAFFWRERRNLEPPQGGHSSCWNFNLGPPEYEDVILMHFHGGKAAACEAETFSHCLICSCMAGECGSIVVWGTMIQAGISQDRVPMRWIFSIYLILPAALWLWGWLSLWQK